MYRLTLAFAIIICSCQTTHLNHKYHIDTSKPVVDFLKDENIKKMRKTPFMLYYELLDSAQRHHVMDSLKREVDSIEFITTHRVV